MKPIIYWHRRDLRLTHNRALNWAAEQGRPVIPVFIYAPEEEAPWQPGAASRWWLEQSLQQLGEQYQTHGITLCTRSGGSLSTLNQLIQESGADCVVWNRLYEPALRKRDENIAATLAEAGIHNQSFTGHLLFEPESIEKNSGGPYIVFTPFLKACRAHYQPDNILPPPPLRAFDGELASEEFAISDQHAWTEKLAQHWQCGEIAALDALEQFVDGALSGYSEQRDRPDKPGTSRLSPHLHFGEITPAQILAAMPQEDAEEDRKKFLSELIWREFAHHLLHHFPDSSEQELNPKFRPFPWQLAPAEHIAAWQQGQTGNDFIDAAMQELWQSGWMHNRTRMLVGSYLCKNLLIDWRVGARWFWDTLVDADLANNSLGWQWIAGCGADAAPFFRIFNPDTQAEKFDPAAHYRQQWLGQRAALPALVDLKQSRLRALDTWKATNKNS